MHYFKVHTSAGTIQDFKFFIFYFFVRIFSKFIGYASYHHTVRSATCVSMWRFCLFLLHCITLLCWLHFKRANQLFPTKAEAPSTFYNFCQLSFNFFFVMLNYAVYCLLIMIPTDTVSSFYELWKYIVMVSTGSLIQVYPIIRIRHFLHLFWSS